MIARWLLTSCLMVGITGAAVAAEATARPFEARDLFGLQAASHPEISPDGRRVAYIRTSFDIATDRPKRTIWLIDVATRASEAIGGTADQGNPRWSPDGKTLAFVGPDKANRPQIHLYRPDSRSVTVLTDLGEGPSDLAWSPDGRSIVFGMSVPKDAPDFAGPGLQPPSDAKWAPPIRIITDVQYKADGAGLIKSGYRHLFSISVAGGSPRQLTSGPYNDQGPVTFSPDGRDLVFASARKPDNELEATDTDLYRLNLSTGALTQLTERHGPDETPAISPDGRCLAWTGYDERYHLYENYLLYVSCDGITRKPRLLTGKLDRSTEQPRWAYDSRSILVTSTDKGVTRVLRVGLDGRTDILAKGLASTQLDRPYSQDGPYPEPRYSISQTGLVATTKGGVDSPPDVVLIDRKGSRALTHLNPQLTSTIGLAKVQPLAVTSSIDGLPIDAWIMTPPDFDPNRKYPLILEIHGGPMASYGPNFGSQLQLYAAAGYVVVYSNPRGSSSYGMDFALKVDKRFPGEDYKDLLSVVDAAIGTGMVDPENLFVTGGSGGGALTAWIVGHSDRFRAAVAQKPVANWSSQLLTADGYSIYWRIFVKKLPWEDPEETWRLSPLSVIGKVNTPTMMIVGEEDQRTPRGEAEQLYAALQLRKIPTALVLVPGAGHDSLPERPSQLAAETAAILGWFEKFRIRR